MRNWKERLGDWLALGTSPEYSGEENRAISNTNAVALLVTALSIPYPPIYLFYLGTFNAWIMGGILLVMLGYVLVLWLNYRHWHFAAKSMFTFVGLLQLSGICLLFGKPTLLYLFFFPAIIMPFYLTTRREIHLRWAVVAVVAGLFFVIQYLFTVMDPIWFVPGTEKPLFQAIVVLSTFLLIVAQGQYFYLSSRKLEDRLEQERQRSDGLLLNILPANIAAELKAAGQVEPAYFEDVTVMFTDFVGFTRVAERYSPVELVAELDHLFSQFDDLMARYGLEKLKTIGDAYMCAGGVPVPDPDSARRAVLAGLEMIRLTREHAREREAAGKPHWEIRVGLHNGPLVAGIIGKNKFIYDVWGDTVNTASRMESHGVPGALTLSEAMARRVEDHFAVSLFGEVEIKNKGPQKLFTVNPPESE